MGHYESIHHGGREHHPPKERVGEETYRLTTYIPSLSVNQLYYLQGGNLPKIPLKTELSLEPLFGPCMTKTGHNNPCRSPSRHLSSFPWGWAASPQPGVWRPPFDHPQHHPKKGSSGQSSNTAKELAWPPAITSGGMAGATFTRDILQAPELPQAQPCCHHHKPRDSQQNISPWRRASNRGDT